MLLADLTTARSMNVTCPACAARYTADEQKLRGKTARMRCRHCDTVWLVSGPPADDVSDRDGDVTAARVRRGSDRDRADLFAPRPSDPGVVRQTLRPPPPQHQRDETVPPPGATGPTARGTAARQETSVLFTLAGLSQDPRTARLKTPEPERTPMAQTQSRAEDDEGIIDLKALASVPPRPGARPAVAPLFSEPPPAAFAVDADASDVRPAVAPKSSGAKRVVTIMGALAAVAVAGLGLAYAFKGEKPAPVAAAMPAPPPPPAVVAPPPPAPQPDPAPAATTAASDDAKTTTTAKGAKKGAKGKAGARAAKASSDAAAAPKPAAPKPAADPCGCKGDFNCVLACTVKKGK